MTSTPLRAATRQASPTARSRRMLLLLALLFLGPLLASIALYGSHWRPAAHTNHGSLIDPPRHLADGLFIGKWSLVYIGAGDCGPDCRQTLYFMRQTHWGLGSLSPRVQRVFLVSDRCCDRASVQDQYPGLIMVERASAAGASALQPFPANERAHSLFIVDPRGNLMMRYDARAAPTGLLDDLRKLLRLSSIG